MSVAQQSTPVTAVTHATGNVGIVKQLADRGEIAEAAKIVAPDHPWPAMSLAPAIRVRTGILHVDGMGTALAWRGGNPWDPSSSTVHALGDPNLAAQLLTTLAAVGERLISTPDALSALPIVHKHYEWDLRSIDLPDSGPVRVASNGGGPEVEWLPAAPSTEREVNALLDQAFPHAAIRPHDERVGRWCGVRDDDGVLVACAAETLPAAPIAHLSALAVLPRVRRRQLGAAVTRFFLTEAFAAGAPKVVLAVDADNPNASNLYDSLGFGTWHLAGTIFSADVS